MPNIVKVKICGVTDPAQAREIARLGADYLGCIIDFPKSLRSVSAEKAREIRETVENARDKAMSHPYDRRGERSFARTVGVVVSVSVHQLDSLVEATGIRIWQLHGDETPEDMKQMKEKGVELWKVVGRENYRQYVGIADAVIVDAKNPVHGAGGSGQLSDWEFARQLIDAGYEVVLSGGLNPENVQEAIGIVQPAVVDVSSGVEVQPGVKDMEKIERLIKNVKSMSPRTEMRDQESKIKN